MTLPPTPQPLRVAANLAARLARIAAAPFFDARLLRGRHFQSIRSPGWRWVMAGIWYQRVLGINREANWPVSPWVRVICPHNIRFSPDDMQNFWSFGIYFQASEDAELVIGDGVYIGPNVGLITSGHVPGNPTVRKRGHAIILGARSWIGMNSTLLPGCELLPGTTVGAGATLERGRHSGVVRGWRNQGD